MVRHNPSMNQTYEEIVADILSLPLHQAVGIELIDSDHPERGVTVVTGPNNVNSHDVLHGGIVPLLLDISSFLAAAKEFEPRTHAVTASNSVSLLRPLPIGKRISVSATVDRRGRNVVFLTARGECEGQVVATGQIVKAVVRLEQP